MYNVETGLKEVLKFLRMCYIHTYNKEMGDVDIADQLRNTYRFDHWMRKRKWWWSIFFWAIGVILVNSYIVYVKLCEEEGVEKKKHYESSRFQKGGGDGMDKSRSLLARGKKWSGTDLLSEEEGSSFSVFQ